MITRWTRVFACALAFALAPGAVLGTDVPVNLVYRMTTRVFEGRVFMDPRLRPYAKLHAHLLAEAKRSFAAIKKDADELGVERLGTYQNHAWTSGITYILRSVAGPIVSVARRDVIDTGGAHPNTEVHATIWDRKAERALTLSDLLIEAREDGPSLTALAALIRESVMASKRKDSGDDSYDPAQDYYLKRIVARADTLGSPTLAPSTLPGKASGLTFQFAPYAIGSFADGVQVAFVPAQAILPLLKPGLRPLFGGERPAEDMKQE